MNEVDSIAQLPGLGLKSEQWLAEVGIVNVAQLKQKGAVRAYLMLEQGCSTKPSLNFFYAMVGALEGRRWQDVAREDKARLLVELESYREMDKLFNSAQK